MPQNQLGNIRRILIAPLNWGLGHATRCIPIINTFQDLEIEVIIGGDGRSLKFLKHTYPNLIFHELPSYQITYSKGKSQMMAMIRQLPKILKAIKHEHQALEKLIETYHLDAVISDNRYGLYNHRIPCFFICHQLAIQVPSIFAPFRFLLYHFHLRQIRKFGQCWIPDFADTPNLSYDLSHKYPIPYNFHFIGPLSRFHHLQTTSSSFSFPQLRQSSPDIAIILSGPEPQRSLLEEILTQQAQKLNRICWIVQGKTEKTSISQEGSVWKISFMETDDMYLLLKQANVVISRPGYSSLMDYAALTLRKVILIPTPGQTEQEYLAEQLFHQRIALAVKQEDIELEQALKEVKSFHGFGTMDNTSQTLSSLIASVLKTEDSIQ